MNQMIGRATHSYKLVISILALLLLVISVNAAVPVAYFSMNGVMNNEQDVSGAIPMFTLTPIPTIIPTTSPTLIPTTSPTIVPTLIPTTSPTIVPTLIPTTSPTLIPTTYHSAHGSAPVPTPTKTPTPVPTPTPVLTPTQTPTPVPTPTPIPTPTKTPTPVPTPTKTPTPVPTPTLVPTPTQTPTPVPTLITGDCYGAEACNPTGNPIGGGSGYNRTISQSSAKYIVSTKSELISSLMIAKSGEIVFISGGAVIDITGSSPITIPAGVIFASDRGKNGSLGGLIKKTKGSQTYGWGEPAFIIGGDNVRVTGIQLEGEMFPSTDTPIVSESLYQVGISSKNNNGIEIDNCELRGFAWASITDNEMGNPGNNGMYVHHNYIHYSLARSEGYGVELYGGNIIIEANIFDNNRHSIACGGEYGEGYEARYNIHLGNGTGIGFAHFDIHSSNGNVYKMHHNTFKKTPVWSIGIQSSGSKKTYIDHNIFETTSGIEPVFQHGTENLFVIKNYVNGKLYAGDEIVGYY